MFRSFGNLIVENTFTVGFIGRLDGYHGWATFSGWTEFTQFKNLVRASMRTEAQLVWQDRIDGAEYYWVQVTDGDDLLISQPFASPENAKLAWRADNIEWEAI